MVAMARHVPTCGNRAGAAASPAARCAGVGLSARSRGGVSQVRNANAGHLQRTRRHSRSMPASTRGSPCA
jgi:hypothetical protein